jgi:hypothetical protein
MKSVKLYGKTLLGLFTLVLLVGAMAGPAAAAQAEPDYSRLKYGLKRLELAVDALQDRIDNFTGAADLTAEFIADEQAKGYDTSELEAALRSFQAKIDEAQALQDTAAQAVEGKAGFDENGEVVDPQQAGETLKATHRAIQDANQTLFPAGQDLRQALRDYRQSKRNSTQ